MKNYKKILKGNIAEIVSNRKQYFQKSDKDFCGDRKLPFETMLYSILSLGSKDLKCEIMDQFGIQADIPSVSAFVQRRGKISSSAMVDRDDCEFPTIYIADRGYESYNNLAHIQEKGQYFLIRIKDVASRGGIAQGLSLPASKEFDVSFSVNLTRKQTNAAKADTNLKYS